MDSKSFNFLKAVLGEDGANALKKAVELAKCDTFSNAILPRTVLGWLEVSPSFSYEGEIPGVDGTFIAFKKSESGFSGRISLLSGDYLFEDAPLIRVAAGIATALGVEAAEVAGAVKNVEIAKLGKSIDLLVKSKAILDYKKNKRLNAGIKEETEEHGGPAGLSAGTIRQIATDHLEENPKAYAKGKNKSPLTKAPGGATEAPAGVAKPQATKPPLAPVSTAPSTVQKKPPKPTGIPTVKREIKLHLTKSQMATRCATCGRTSFTGDKFTACLCFLALAKSVKVEKEGEGVVLGFSPEWDAEAVFCLSEILKG